MNPSTFGFGVGSVISEKVVSRHELFVPVLLLRHRVPNYTRRVYRRNLANGPGEISHGVAGQFTER